MYIVIFDKANFIKLLGENYYLDFIIEPYENDFESLEKEKNNRERKFTKKRQIGI